MLLLIACVKNKILVLVLASSCEKEPRFQRKERQKENFIFGNLSQTEILSKEGSFRKLLIGQIRWGRGKEVGGLKTSANARNKIM